jgi:hypothetical protein
VGFTIRRFTKQMFHYERADIIRTHQLCRAKIG